jgi:hypothetical protein
LSSEKVIYFDYFSRSPVVFVRQMKNSFRTEFMKIGACLGDMMYFGIRVDSGQQNPRQAVFSWKRSPAYSAGTFSSHHPPQRVTGRGMPINAD